MRAIPVVLWPVHYRRWSRTLMQDLELKAGTEQRLRPVSFICTHAWARLLSFSHVRPPGECKEGQSARSVLACSPERVLCASTWPEISTYQLFLPSKHHSCCWSHKRRLEACLCKAVIMPAVDTVMNFLKLDSTL